MPALKLLNHPIERLSMGAPSLQSDSHEQDLLLFHLVISMRDTGHAFGTVSYGFEETRRLAEETVTSQLVKFAFEPLHPKNEECLSFSLSFSLCVSRSLSLRRCAKGPNQG